MRFIVLPCSHKSLWWINGFQHWLFLPWFFWNSHSSDGRNHPNLFLIGVLALSFLLIYKTTGDINLLIVAYLVIGAYGVSFRKIVRVYCGIGIPFLLFCIVALQIGLLLDYIIDMTWADRGLRHSFGIIYPTYFTAHVTYLMLGWGRFRGKKITSVELCMFVLCTLAVYFFLQRKN